MGRTSSASRAPPKPKGKFRSVPELVDEAGEPAPLSSEEQQARDLRARQCALGLVSAAILGGGLYAVLSGFATGFCFVDHVDACKEKHADGTTWNEEGMTAAVGVKALRKQLSVVTRDVDRVDVAVAVIHCI